MNWKARVAIWLLKDSCAGMELKGDEMLLFIDSQRIDVNDLLDIQIGSSAPTIHIIECKPQQKSVKDCVVAVSLPRIP